MTENKIPRWLIAEKLGVHENTVYRILRSELTERKREEIIEIIKDLSLYV